MAKSTRSSDRKRNNAKLRANIFGPAQDARTARLSAKLQELASKPKPEQPKTMDVDEIEPEVEAEENAAGATEQDSDVDMSSLKKSAGVSKRKSSSSRIEKKYGRRKPRNKVVFPTSAAKRKRIAQSKKKSV